MARRDGGSSAKPSLTAVSATTFSAQVFLVLRQVDNKVEVVIMSGKFQGELWLLLG